MFAARSIGLIAAIFLFAAATANAQQFSLVDLGTLGGASSYATDVNSAGQVVGYAYTAGNAEHAFLYSGGHMIDLGTGGGPGSQAFGINDLGQVVGSYSAASGPHAFIWSNGVFTDLGTGGAATSSAFAINNSSTVVGQFGDSTNGYSAFMWNNGGFTNLGNGGASRAKALDINSSGTVVGQYGAGTSYAFKWSNGTFSGLGLTGAEATAIDDAGDIVGDYSVGWPSYHAFIRLGSSNFDLGTLGGFSSGAEDIVSGIPHNGIGVVGWADTSTGAGHAFLYENGRMVDLNQLDTTSALAPYVTLTDATAISANGWIVADGVDSRTGQTHAYLLGPPSPVPLPSAAWLLISGVGGLGGIRAMMGDRRYPLTSSATASKSSHLLSST